MSKETVEVKKAVAPKVGQLQFNHVLLTTEYKGQQKSSIILTENMGVNEKPLFETQKVIAAGPQAEAGGIKPGVMVYLDVDRLMAPGDSSGKITHIRRLYYHRYTGELITGRNFENYPEHERDEYMVLTDREILMILG